ncbi:MAG: radical SAM protein [Candidatus Thermoplasmatota archaeon]
MKINEIFYSIQGEGKWTGLPNIFIRTTGCNLRCEYCDTKYAYYQGKNMEIKEIEDKISKYPCKNICITGGEPLLQKDITELITKLTTKKYSMLIETNGSKDIKKIKQFEPLIISLDIKCPSSKMHKKMKLKNIDLLTSRDQIKFIVKNEEDYIYAKKIIEKYQIDCTTYIQPVWGEKYQKFAEMIKKDGLKVRLGIQLHKVIWNNKKRV